MDVCIYVFMMYSVLTSHVLRYSIAALPTRPSSLYVGIQMDKCKSSAL